MLLKLTFGNPLQAAPSGQSTQVVQFILLGILSFKYSVFLQSCGIFHGGFSQLVCILLGILPSVHDLQCNCLRSSLYSLAGQRMHWREGLPNVPKSQLLQEAAPSSVPVVSPSLHCRHCVKSLSSADRNHPVGHVAQPCPSCPNVPSTQGWHEALLLVTVLYPMGQSLHVD